MCSSSQQSVAVYRKEENKKQLGSRTVDCIGVRRMGWRCLLWHSPKGKQEKNMYSALLLPWDVQNPYSHWAVACTPQCWYSAAVPSVMDCVLACGRGILYISVSTLMNLFVIGKHFNCQNTFSFKSINISEQSFWKETLLWAVMIHASVKWICTVVCYGWSISQVETVSE